MVFDSTSLVGAQTQDTAIEAGETFSGSYFGARGQYQCVGPDAAGNNCGLMRNADGTVGLFDQATATAGVQNGQWTFTPAPGAMIAVPDQDWMLYGAWLTTPDNATGQHRLGAFFSGMDTYTHTDAAGNNVFTAGATNLTGSATYSGGAVGTYRHLTAAGLFTATASLTANFDVNGNLADDAPNDFTISGRIDDFRGTDGQFLGRDTAANPNDPVAGGENDWVVLLNAADLTAIAAGTFPAAGTTAATTGSADGVQWNGFWSGQLYGPDTVAGNAVAPTGVGGQFRASNANTAVVGAFGARAD